MQARMNSALVSPAVVTILWSIPIIADIVQATALLFAGIAIFISMLARAVNWRRSIPTRRRSSWPIAGRFWRNIKNDRLHHHGGRVHHGRLRRASSQV